MAVQTRHLKAVPDESVADATARIDGELRWLHVLNGICRNERELRHLIKEAKKLGRPETAAALDVALQACDVAKGALRS
jgi:hypothetical protein